MRYIMNLFSRIVSSEQPVVSYEDYEPLNSLMETTVPTSHRSLRINY